jgi:hypothetical protein
MLGLKEEIFEKVNVKELAVFLGLSGVTMLLPFFVHIQWITGPLVNALLIINLFIVGIRSTLVLALVPSLMALSAGLLPAVLAPAVPFIMIGNVIYILLIDRIYNNAKNQETGYWLGLVIASGLKFTFLFLSVSLIANLITKQEIIAKVAQMMTWPQFATAFIGGMIAYMALKWIKRI